MVRRIILIADGVLTTDGTDRTTAIHTMDILHRMDTTGDTTGIVSLFSIRRVAYTGHGIPGMCERQECGVITDASPQMTVWQGPRRVQGPRRSDRPYSQRVAQPREGQQQPADQQSRLRGARLSGLQ